MTFWPILVALGAAYLLQSGLAIIQMKDFNTTFRDLRRQGKVAIGVKKGAFRSGAIVMCCVNESGSIVDARSLSGVTVVSRFRSLRGFEGRDIRTVSGNDFRQLPKGIRTATDNARENYLTIMSGGTIAEPQSPLGRLAAGFTSLRSKRKD